MQFGSTQKEDDTVSLDELRGLNRQEHATLDGLLQELKQLKAEYKSMYEQQNVLINLVMTLQGRVEAINTQRALDLQGFYGNGPTDGTDDRPSTEADNDTAG